MQAEQAEEERMFSYGFVVPVLPGMVERNRAFAAELAGPRKAEHEASRARMGITRELVWQQEAPDQTLSVVYLEGEDMERAFMGLATSQDPHDLWWRAQILEIHGIDLSQPLPGEPNELISELRRG
jgi:hypothetical protein